jgi:hypothetical protein
MMHISACILKLLFRTKKFVFFLFFCLLSYGVGISFLLKCFLLFTGWLYRVALQDGLPCTGLAVPTVAPGGII